jgi:two-component system sensor histidine kinase YesM
MIIRKKRPLLPAITFFNKILLSYATITICIVIVLAHLILQRVSERMLEQEVKYNQVMLYNLDQFIEQKYNTAKKILTEIYYNNYGNRFINAFLEDRSTNPSFEYIEAKKRFDSEMNVLLNTDKDLANLSVYKPLTDSLHLYSNNSKTVSNIYRSDEIVYRERIHSIRETGLTVLPAYKPHHFKRGHGTVFSFATAVKQQTAGSVNGYLMVEIDVETLSQELVPYGQSGGGRVLVLTSSGEVVFDSAEGLYGESYPYLASVKQAVRGARLQTIDGEEQIIVAAVASGPNLVIASIVPKEKLLKAIEATVAKMIFITAGASVLLALLLIALTTQFFSRRVRRLTAAMRKIRNGDLTVRVPAGSSRDEIEEIGSSLNIMADSLNTFINRAYVSELRQKNAELKALQSQINPHFLYNALETIRMKAIGSGDPETGQMLRHLASYFRSSIKARTVVSIQEELDQSRNYLGLYGIRYNDRLSIHIEMSPEVKSLGTIKHVVQPLAENYIVHGFDSTRSDNHIWIYAELKDDTIIIRAIDNGRGMQPQHLARLQVELEQPILDNGAESIGLRNTQDRIRLLFGQRYGLTIQAAKAGGIEATIRMPSMRTEELLKYVKSHDR